MSVFFEEPCDDLPASEKVERKARQISLDLRFARQLQKQWRKQRFGLKDGNCIYATFMCVSLTP